MHMADALVSPAVAGVAGIAAVGALAVAAIKVKKDSDRSIVPLMGVMGAFIFAAQMINFSIPGTGSSGHIIGGVLLASMLGPWAALITLASVLVVQCLLFADGGLMALGCNILNMGICTTLIAYPLVFKPLMKKQASFGRIMFASVSACILGLELGALLVTCETELSGITALSWNKFAALMGGIHLAIGLGEGLATGLVVWYVQRYSPTMLIADRHSPQLTMKRNTKKVLVVLACVALVLGVAFAWIASSNPDGLEWSIAQISGSTDLPYTADIATHEAFQAAQTGTSLIPDYDSHWAGIVGCCVVVAITWACSSILTSRRKTGKLQHKS